MPSNPQPNRIIRGFTILELIVALGVTVLMLFMISALFTVTSDGVSLGVAVSDVIGAGRAVGDQIERDAAAMVRPDPSGLGGGVMVIICHRVEMPYMERRVLKTRWVRMDQIMWIRSANGAGSANPDIIAMAPARVSQYGPPTAGETKSAQYGMVWYGHPLKTPPAGTAPTAFGALGANRVANQLALARQMLLLCGDSADLATLNRVNGAAWNAPVVGMTHPGGANMRYQGTTDVANLPYIFDPSLSPAPAFGGLIGPANSTSGNPNMLTTDLAEATYRDRALNYMFFPENRRLWVNPNPAVDIANPLPAGLIAQRHGLFMDNVSDFIVEFAGDALDDQTVPYDAEVYGDGVPDSFPVGSGANAGETIWYGLSDNPKSNSMGPPTWTNFQTPTGNPAIPIPNHIISAGNTVAYVFRHDFPQRWPFMVRMRFRIHDQRGELLGDVSPENEVTGPITGTNVGKWFEQIIKVNRD